MIFQVNPETVERYDGVIGEAATSFRGDSVSVADNIFS
jgi:hypothetical protein